MTVGVISIPQAMAYAAIVGVSPIYGLFTAVIPVIVSAIFGDYPYLVSGLTNPTALVLASAMIPFADSPNFLQLVFGIALLSGIFKLLVGVFKLGKLVRFLSHSVMVGFLSAIALVIIIGQLGSLLGVALPKGSGILPPLRGLAQNLTRINPYAAFIGLLSIILILIGKRLGRKLPAALIVVVLTTILVAFFGLNSKGVQVVKDVGLPSTSAIISFHFPALQFKEWISILLPAMAVALFGMVETTSICKAMAIETGYDINPSKEMVGQGLGNIAGGFFQCLPSSGSPSRTAANVNFGARTKLATVISGITVLLTILFLSKWIMMIPMATLAAIVITASFSLVNLKAVKQTANSSPISALVMVVTFIATLFMPLINAILVGMALSSLIYLNEQHILLNSLKFTLQGEIVEASAAEIEAVTPVIDILNIEGELFFGVVDDLYEDVRCHFKPGVAVLILRVRRMHFLTSSGVMIIEKLIRDAKRNGTTLILSGVTPELEKPLQETGLAEQLGQDNIFRSDRVLFRSTKQAYARALELVDGMQPKAE